MISDLGHLISESDHLVIILGSTNGAAFSAGADLGLTDVDRAKVSRALYQLYHTIRSKGAWCLQPLADTPWGAAPS